MGMRSGEARLDKAEGPAHYQKEWAWTLLLLCCGTGLLLWTFWETVTATVSVWDKSDSFGHGYFIVPIVAFVFYRLRHRLLRQRPVSNPWALAVIAGWLAVMMLGELANLMIVKQFAIVGLWQGFFFLLAGWRATRVAAFPLFYLFFAVPFGVSFIPVLQDITAQFVVHLVRLSGVPIFLDGYYIQIPTGNFLVAEACSGARYLMVCVAIGFLAAHLLIRSRRRQAIFISLSLIVPIVANGIRAYGIVIIAHLSDNTIAVGVDHVLYGFVFLSFVTLVLLGFALLLRDPADTVVSPNETLSWALGKLDPRRAAIQGLTSALGIAVILSSHAWVLAAKAPLTPNKEARLIAPVPGADWELVSNTSPHWAPSFSGADLELQQGYAADSQQVDLHIAYYAYQREGAEAVSEINSIVGASRNSSIIRSKRAQITVDGTLYPMTQSVILSTEGRFLVWHWYWVGGEFTNTPLMGKILEIKALVFGGERAAAVIAIGAKVGQTVEEAEQNLHSLFTRAIKDNERIVQVVPTVTKAQLSTSDSVQ